MRKVILTAMMALCLSLVVLPQVFAQTPYTIDHSCRFNDDDSAYLEWAPTESGNRKTWTFAAWIKRGNVDENFGPLFSCGSSTGNGTELRFRDNSQIQFKHEDSGTVAFDFKSIPVYRDTKKWVHVFLAVDTTNPTAADRVKIYMDGVRITEWNKENRPSSNKDTDIGRQHPFRIGRPRLDVENVYYDGYMADAYYIDGNALEPVNFGQLINGSWVPKEYTGSYGGNGFHLNFADSANPGNDVSGNDHHLTANNLAINDQVIDTPTNNFCTLNPLDTVDGTLSNGNLEVVTPSASGRGRGTMIIPPAVKAYFEVTLNTVSGNPFAVGFRPAGDNISSAWGQANDRMFFSGPGHTDNGKVWDGSSWSASYGTPVQGDVIGFAVFDSKLWISINNTWVNSGDPASGTGYVLDNLPNDIMPCWFDEAGTQSAAFHYNFGQLGFQYTPPTGFKPLSSESTALPEITFSAAPYTIEYEQSSTLTWSTIRADTVEIDQEIGSVDPAGSTQVSPPGTMTYTITATNDNGSVSESVTITVNNGFDVAGIYTVSGNVGIGTMNPQSTLAVNGTITAKKVVVTLTGWPDHVFNRDYRLPSLESVESYINQNNHLPDIPSEEQIRSNGLSMGDMMTLHMQKIEELTLYLIQLKKENNELKSEIDSIKKKLIENPVER